MIAQRYFIFHFYRLLFEPTELNGVSGVHYLFGSDVVHSVDSSITVREFLFAYFSEHFRRDSSYRIASFSAAKSFLGSLFRRSLESLCRVTEITFLPHSKKSLLTSVSPPVLSKDM